MNTNWKEILESYPENEDMILLYEEWGETDYLKEIIGVLNDFNPDWNKERELGSWAAEFILDLLEDTEEELEDMSAEERIDRWGEMIEERYEDFRNGHQFARINNVAIHAETTDLSVLNIREQVDKEGEKIGFPILV